MDCSTAGFPVLHHLPEFAQTYVHRVDVIQPSHPLTSPSPPVFNLSQHQGLFQWLNSSHLAAKELQLPFHYQPFQWISQLTSFKIEWFDLLSDQGTLKSLPTHHSSKASILQRSAFFMGPTLKSIHDYWKNHSFDYMNLCWQSDVSAF